MCAAVISACLPTLRPSLRMAAVKMGFTRFQYATKSSASGAGSGNMNNTIGSSGTNPKSMSFATISGRRSIGNVFGAGRRPLEDTEMHRIMDDEERSYRPDEWTLARDGKGSSLSPSAIEMDTDREGSITMQPVHKVSSNK